MTDEEKIRRLESELAVNQAAQTKIESKINRLVMQPEFHIMEGETIASALRRTLGREPTADECNAKLGMRPAGQSVCEPGFHTSQSEDHNTTQFQQT
jgi:hypothetical protein